MTQGECLKKALTEVFRFDLRPDLYKEILDCDPERIYTELHDTRCPDGRGAHLWSLTITEMNPLHGPQQLLHASIPEHEANRFKMLLKKYRAEMSDVQVEQKPVKGQYILQLGRKVGEDQNFISLRKPISEKLARLIQYLVDNDY